MAGNKLPTAQALSAAFYLLCTAVGDGLFTIRMLLFSIGNSAINDPRYWERRNERSRMLATARWDQCECTDGYTKRMRSLRSAFEKADSQSEQIFKCHLSLQRNEFHACVGNLFPSSQSKNKEALYTLKGSHRMGHGVFFLKTSASHSLMTTYRINPLTARSISLDSTFKDESSYPKSTNTFKWSDKRCPTAIEKIQLIKRHLTSRAT
jgi:hypothetical protein